MDAKFSPAGEQEHRSRYLRAFALACPAIETVPQAPTQQRPRPGRQRQNIFWNLGTNLVPKYDGNPL